MNNAPDVPRDRWHAMTRLDENRAKSLLAKKAGAEVTAVTNVAIWAIIRDAVPGFLQRKDRRQGCDGCHRGRKPG